ncbi:major facilitator superfamily domain-containing protein [Apiosordaria backusii]|uniref:Major facilitator superfamily domain-containing protein n=1 Tax=Apiosordaria backusii TaxID=314023 RepID=A0AA39ZP60_9PEZI|nr:major facilitator superfamily domain-containing protein [Apiosordaria backusii]
MTMLDNSNSDDREGQSTTVAANNTDIHVGDVGISSTPSTSTTAGDGKPTRKMIITPPSTTTESWESESDDPEKGYGHDNEEEYGFFERGRGRSRRGRGHDDDDDDDDDDEDDEEQSPHTIKRKPNPQKEEFIYTLQEEKAVVRKFDRKVVVFMAVLYMLAFLDRSNIGNARIANMDSDLQSDPPNPQLYSYALSSFYLAYLLFEWMAILWRLIPAHVYVAVLVASWGVVACLQGVATSYPVLIGLRFLLGIGEAGFTGVPFYLSFFFRRGELALRTAVFISAAPLATSFSSTLAFAITSLSNVIPIAPWRLLFLIEGLPSQFLTARQKKIARVRLQSEHQQAAPLAVGAAYLPYSSLPAFLPTILTAMGHSSLSSQALSAPPYLLSFLIVLVTAYLSDLYRSRGPFLICHALCSCAGYLVLAFSERMGLEPGSWLRYAAVFPAAVGFFNVVVLTIAWNVNNQKGGGKEKGVGFALMQVVGQLGPLVATRLYPDGDGPFFTSGMGVCAAAMGGVVVLAAGLVRYMDGVNKRWEREEKEREGEEGVQLMEGERGIKAERGGLGICFNLTCWFMAGGFLGNG